MAEQDNQKPLNHEKWIRTSHGWKTCKTIVLINKKIERFRSEWKGECVSSGSNRGFTWRTNSPLVILPGYYARGPVFYFVSVENHSAEEEPSTITDAFQALDIPSTVKDTRKFGYTCKLLELLLKSKSLSLDSFATEEVFLALSVVVDQVILNEENLEMARLLLRVAKKSLWERRDTYVDEMYEEWMMRRKNINDLICKLRKCKIKKGQQITMKAPKLEELPDECLRLILHRLTHHKDICRLSQVNRHFNKLCHENLLWKNLCRFHFSETQLVKQSKNVQFGWQKIYRTLLRKYPLRELYADMLVLCSYCHFMFWKFSRHKCTYDLGDQNQKPPVSIAITPKGFLLLFDV